MNGVQKDENEVISSVSDIDVYINVWEAQKSDWGAAFIVSWDRDLLHDELIKVSNFLMDGTMGPVETLQLTVTTSSGSAPTDAASTPTYFSWSLSVDGYSETKCTNLASSCISTGNFATADTCTANGLQILIPRSKSHWMSLIERFGWEYFTSALTGIYLPGPGASFAHVAMNSEEMPETGYV